MRVDGDPISINAALPCAPGKAPTRDAHTRGQEGQELPLCPAEALFTFLCYPPHALSPREYLFPLWLHLCLVFRKHSALETVP